jgi:uncharacterized protein
MPSFLSPLLNMPGGRFGLRNERTGATLAGHLETAFDSASRNRGLLGRDGLDAGHALIIAPCSSIHTFFMRFTIDVLFVAKDGRVVKVRPHVRPWRMALAFRSFAVVELPAGASADTRPGDRLELVPGA